MEKGQGVTLTRSVEGIYWRRTTGEGTPCRFVSDNLNEVTGGVGYVWHVYTVSLEESLCRTDVSWTRTKEIWVVNLEGHPLNEPIVLPGVISEAGCTDRERQKKGWRSTLMYRTYWGEGGRPGLHTTGEERPRHLLYVTNNKVRRRHRVGWLCWFGLRDGSVPRGSLTDRVCDLCSVRAWCFHGRSYKFKGHSPFGPVLNLWIQSDRWPYFFIVHFGETFVDSGRGNLEVVPSRSQRSLRGLSLVLWFNLLLCCRWHEVRIGRKFRGRKGVFELTLRMQKRRYGKLF